MGKKLRKIKINKFWKDIFSNKPLVIFVAVLVLAIVFTNKNISQYFKPSGSQAASGWTVTNITPGISGIEKVQDVSGKNLVFTKQSQPNLSDNYISIWLYDFVTKTTTLVANLSPLYGSGDVRINGNKTVWWRQNKNSLYDMYVYDIDLKQSKVVLSNVQANPYLLDIWQNKIIYAERTQSGDLIAYALKLFNLSTNKISYIGTRLYVSDVKFDANRFVWMIRTGQNSDELWMYDFGTSQLTKISPNISLTMFDFDLFGDVVVASAFNPGAFNIFTYNIIAKTTSQITFQGTNYGPSIWGNKVAYCRTDKSLGEIHFVDILSPLDSNELVGLLPANSVSGVVSPWPLITSFGGHMYIAWAEVEDSSQGDVVVATK